MLKKLLLISLIIIGSFCGILFLSSVNTLYAFTDATIYIYDFDYKTFTIDEDFTGNIVIVTIEDYHSMNHQVTIYDFITENIRTQSCSENVADEQLIFISEKIDLMPLTSPNVLFLLELVNYCKNDVLIAIYELNQLDIVYVAEPEFNYVAMSFLQPGQIPNDNYFDLQWGLTGNQGINIMGAWSYTRGNRAFRVGIMEGGFDIYHPDIFGNHSVPTGNWYPPRTSNFDHGTHVAGIIGAQTNNSNGIAGIAQISMVNLNWNNFASQLDWAIANDIKIVNASFGGVRNALTREPANHTSAQRTAVERFGRNGGVLIAAAGNSGKTQFGNSDNTPFFPAGFGDNMRFPNITNVIAVGSTQKDGLRSDFSNYGSNAVNIFAPGSNIVSTFPESRWGTLISGYNQISRGFAIASGTSMAAPHVTGVAVLIRDINRDLSAVQVRDIILNNADTRRIHSPSLGNHYVRFLNAHRAVAASALRTTTVGNSLRIEGLQSSIFALPNNLVLEIPSSINGRNVTSISSNAFANLANIISVILPAFNIINIENAFNNNVNLRNITRRSNLDHSSGGLGTSFTAWRTVETLPRLNYSSFFQSGFRSKRVTINLEFGVFGTIQYELRLINLSTNSVISTGLYTPGNGENHFRSHTFGITDLDSLNQNHNFVVQIRYRKTQLLWGGHFDLLGINTETNFFHNSNNPHICSFNYRFEARGLINRIWMHEAFCICGTSRLEVCQAIFNPITGGRTCASCNQYLGDGSIGVIFQFTLPNGIYIVSDRSLTTTELLDLWKFGKLMYHSNGYLAVNSMDNHAGGDL